MANCLSLSSAFLCRFTILRCCSHLLAGTTGRPSSGTTPSQSFSYPYANGVSLRDGLARYSAPKHIVCTAVATDGRSTSMFYRFRYTFQYLSKKKVNSVNAQHRTVWYFSNYRTKMDRNSLITAVLRRLRPRIF